MPFASHHVWGRAPCFEEEQLLLPLGSGDGLTRSPHLLPTWPHLPWPPTSGCAPSFHPPLLPKVAPTSAFPEYALWLPRTPSLKFTPFIYLLFIYLFIIAAPAAYGSSQARDSTRAVADEDPTFVSIGMILGFFPASFLVPCSGLDKRSSPRAGSIQISNCRGPKPRHRLRVRKIYRVL